jgi:hypothetical protein
MQAAAVAAEHRQARRALVVLAAVLQRLIVRSMAPQELQTPAAAAPVKAKVAAVWRVALAAPAS